MTAIGGCGGWNEVAAWQRLYEVLLAEQRVGILYRVHPSKIGGYSSRLIGGSNCAAREIAPLLRTSNF
ncbi:hypothetical protein [Streptomyces acidicola]|uniref:hypothetical protein n=1 Tax=Streptomyces acidicola TaxID=2596892 RepID=UPI003816C18A